MKRFLCAALSLAMILAAFSACSPAQPQNPNTSQAAAPSSGGGQKVEMAVATAAAGAAYYPIGSAISDILSLSNLGVNARVQTTGGGVENVKLVNNGDCEIGITVSYLAYNGYNAISPYPANMDNIRLLFSNLSTGVLQIVVPTNSPIQSIADLKGKKIAVGPAGNGGLTVIADLLPKYGIGKNDYTPSYVPYEEGITMMEDGHVDASIVYSAVPAAAIQSMTASKKSFRMLDVEEKILSELMNEYSYYEAVVIGKDVYSLDVDSTTIGTTNIVIVNKDLSDDMVYNMLDLLFTPENLEKIKLSHPSAKKLELETSVNMVPIPLHPGAERFFKEKGLLK